MTDQEPRVAEILMDRDEVENYSSWPYSADLEESLRQTALGLYDEVERLRAEVEKHREYGEAVAKECDEWEQKVEALESDIKSQAWLMAKQDLKIKRLQEQLDGDR